MLMLINQSPKLGPKLKGTPIHSLPDDILAVIFVEGSSIKSFDYKNWPLFEVVVSHVSGRWREVAINLAALWSTIYVIPLHSPDMLKAYLERSKERLLDIKFHFYHFASPIMELGHNLKLCVNTLIAHAERWRLFAVNSNSYAIAEIIIGQIRELSAPNLVYCSISLDEESLFSYVDEYGPDKFIFMGGAPRLSYFECRGVSIETCWPPMGALTELRIGYYEVAHITPLAPSVFHQLLTASSALTTIRLEGRIVDEGEILPIELPHLTVLYIDLDFDDSYTRELFSAISTPALTSLILAEASEDTIDAFVDTMRNSYHLPKYPALNHLGLYGGECNELSRDLIDALPGIKSLSFAQCDDTFVILAALTSQDAGVVSTTVPWPRLRGIAVDPFNWREGIRPLRDFVSARSGSGYPLDTVILREGEEDVQTLLIKVEFLKPSVQLVLLRRRADTARSRYLTPGQKQQLNTAFLESLGS